MSYIPDAIPCEVVDTTTPVPQKQHSKNRIYVQYYIPDSEVLSSLDRNAKIILFDDYYDTGETIASAASAMQAIGFSNINVFTLVCSKSVKRRFMRNHKR